LTLQAACVAPEDVAQRRGYSDRSNAERGQAFLSDGNDGGRFDDRRLRLVGDQFAQERNQHDERNADREAAEAPLQRPA